MTVTPPGRAGLCASCRFAEVITSSRGSMFYLCTLAAIDPRFRRYPVLPVHHCEGYEPAPAAGPAPPARPPLK